MADRKEKKRDMDSDCEDIGGDISHKKLKRDEEDLVKSICPVIKAALLSLTTNPIYSLCGIRLKQCNGSVGYGIPFSSAFCDTEFIKDPWFPFGYIFEQGIITLCNFLKNSLCEKDIVSLRLCRKLLKCIQDEGLRSTLEVLQNEPSRDARKRTETQVSFTMAEHLLSKLALNDTYTLDRTVKKGEHLRCICGCGADIETKFGDTSIGKQNVWHGHLDIMIGHGVEELPVLISPKEEEDDDADTLGKLRGLDDKFVEDQMIAETIVFSFLQRKNYPTLDHFLIPLIGISAKEVIFYFYDSENDILLRSTCMKLYTGGSLCYPTVIAIWLVINYKYFGSGLKGQMTKMSKSNFFNLAGEMIKVYKEELKHGNVLYSTPQPNRFDPAIWDVGHLIFPDYKIPM